MAITIGAGLLGPIEEPRRLDRTLKTDSEAAAPRARTNPRRRPAPDRDRAARLEEDYAQGREGDAQRPSRALILSFRKRPERRAVMAGVALVAMTGLRGARARKGGEHEHAEEGDAEEGLGGQQGEGAAERSAARASSRRARGHEGQRRRWPLRRLPRRRRAVPRGACPPRPRSRPA